MGKKSFIEKRREQGASLGQQYGKYGNQYGMYGQHYGAQYGADKAKQKVH
ncbi:hypothetical protein [Candidatus Ichthyocystis hellenicum]|nr:hypothetical protein [Candidatus Ichthyocystis hellenicum]